MDARETGQGTNGTEHGHRARRGDFVHRLVWLSQSMPRWLQNSPEHIAVDLHRFVSALLETNAVEVRLMHGRLIVEGRVDGPPRDRRTGAPSRSVRAVRVPIGVDGALGAITIAADGKPLPTSAECALLEAAANQAAVALRHLRLDEEFRRTRQELSAKASQQAVMTRLGLRFLDPVTAPELYAMTLSELRESLHVDYCDAFELDPATRTLLLRAADGWPEGYIGTHRVPAEPDCEVGLALASLQPVVVVDGRHDTRFRAHALPAGIRATSGIVVAVPGLPAPLGAVGVHTMDHRAFSDGEILFVQSVANLLASALRHRRSGTCRSRSLRAGRNTSGCCRTS